MILETRHKQILIDIAEETFTSSCEIWAYGSRVNGDCHSGSDLDLVLVPKGEIEEISIDEFVSFKEKISDSNIPILVEVLNWSVIPDSFKENIRKKYEVLFSK